MRLGISEILQLVNDADGPKEKAELLRKHDSPVLRTIIKHLFDKSIKFLIPNTIKYKKNNLVDQENLLYYEAKKLYLFVENGHPTLTQEKREKLFVNFLENLSPADAALVYAMSQHKNPFPKIHRLTIEKVFPGLIT